jgi:hypothetical protein
MFKFYRSVLAAGVVALGLAACGDNVTVSPPPPPSGGVSLVTVTPPSITIGVGQTEQLAVSVVADSGISTAVDWTTGNALVATVSSSGVVTGVGLGSTSIIATSHINPARSAAAQVTVSNAATFSITPNTLPLAPGQSSSVSATAVLQAGQTASAIVWTSLTPSVATVASGCTTTAGTSTCAITGVSQGSAVITASTTVGGQNLTATVAVTVGQGASISIQSVTEGATAGDTLAPGAVCAGVVNAPVILTNVNCQIDVTLNLDAGIQPLDKLVITIVQGSHTKVAAQQIYNGTIPSTGPVTLSVNTANFTKNQATGTASVDYYNGPTSMIVQVFPTHAVGGTVVDCQTGANDPTCAVINSMIFTNFDGWAGDVNKCSAVITPAAVCPAANPAGPTPTGGFATDVGGSTANLGKTYWGGPTATGEITAELYAVVYDDNPAYAPGSSLNRCNNQVGDGTGCISTVSWTIGSTAISTGHCPFMPQSATVTPLTPLFVQTFGTTGEATVTNGCSGHQNILTRRDNIIIQSPTLDAQNNGFPINKLIPNTVVFAATPDSFRLDWAPPTGVALPAVIGAEGFNWINAMFAFNPGGTLGTDAGVGPAPATWLAFASTSGGSGPFLTPITTGADLPETNQNCAGLGCDGFTAIATLDDLLGNTATTGATASFGVDKTAPMVRYSTKVAPSLYAAIYDSGGTAAVHDSTTYWAIEGVYGANVVTVGAQVRFLAGAAGTNDSFRIEALDNRSGLSRAVENTINFSQAGAPCGTAGGCTTVSSITTGVFGAATIDGWRPAPAFHITNGIAGGAPPTTPGYYTTTGFVVDRAGNVSGCPITGPILGAVTGTASICTAAPPSVTAGTNSATGVVGANEFFRRTLALDPAQPLVTGVSPNAMYVADSSATFTLGAQNDLEVIDARLSLQYPNVTIGNVAGTPANGGLITFGPAVPIATRFDASIVNPVLAPVMLDLFTVNIQETCTGPNGGGGIGRPASGPTTATFCATASAGDPIDTTTGTGIALTKPNFVAVQVRDVFGSFINNTTAGAATGVSANFASPILSATVPAPGSYFVTYDGSVLCPQGGVVGGACVIGGINFRADGISGSTYNYRATEPLSVTLPIFTRVDLFGLNALNQWVFIQRCTIPATISPNTGAQGCGGGTVTGTDNGLERYWVYSFTSVPVTGFTEFRALGVNSSGFGLFSTVQP